MGVRNLAKKPLSHYVPKFSNKYWADESNFVSYFFCEHTGDIKTSLKGKKQWGRLRGLYSWEVEHNLDRDLETKVAPIYEKLATINELDINEKLLWSQFILSQLVRTPTFLRYERAAKEISGVCSEPEHDRVGCPHCLDLNFIANRDWLLLVAHDDDYFVRSDNPVLQTGFIEQNSTCFYYPLTPKLCFVACSMREDWDAFESNDNPMIGLKLPKGWAHMLNFHFAKCAGNSLIIAPQDDGYISNFTFPKVLGVYPQPPFSLHSVCEDDTIDAYKSIKYIMSKTDQVKYSDWNVSEISPMYQRHEIA
ncbi:TPA: DUF4238 domain-containing protein [Vibrio vulnificus]|nr:DUF4238 domain-containing protein [Vibrio vulnificus]RZQ38785.1 DUF4238 domain-containing protein [Vibrio vulnificus]HAS8484087.1 DUF4238 domain-containing protein [Vibrio vulnificus]